MMKYTAVILAAGRGSRMESKVQKQFLDLDGYPLIYYALHTFQQSCVDDIVLVTGQDAVSYCRTEIVEKYQFHKVSRIVSGGSERYLSVYNGLCAAENTDIVLIHDGARPFVTEELIERTIRAAEQYGSGIAAVPAKDTVRLADANGFVVQTPARESVWMMQTPQTFQYNQIMSAYEMVVHEKMDHITDDAMVMEQTLRKSVKLVLGSYRNLKITTPEDMEIAAALLQK